MDRRSELLTRCLDEILAGKSSLDDCLGKHPELGDELRDLLSVAMRVHRQSAAIPPGFRQEARARLFTEGELTSAPAKGKGFWDWLRPVRLADGLRVPVAALLVAVGILGSGAGVVYAAQDSLPGEMLYPVKISSENVRLALTFTSESKARLNLAIVERRVEEAVVQSERGQNVSAETHESVARHLDAAIKEINDLDENKSKSLISLLSESTINQQATLSQLISVSLAENKAALEETIDASRRGSTVAVVADANPSFLDSSPSVSDDDLEHNYFKIEGILLSAGDDWHVGGITLSGVSVPQDARYAVGGRVSIEGIIRGGKTFISGIKQKDGAGDNVKLEGVFGGTSPDGSIWYISGIPVGRPAGMDEVAEGTKLTLTGRLQDGSFVVTDKSSGDDEPRRDVKITGRLLEVSADNNTIIVQVAGARITANIANAQIRAESGASLDRSGLGAMIGREVRVSGLRSQEGVIYASKVHVDDENQGKEKPDGQKKD